MSKNLTRKGLAFGALVALAGSVFAGSPALAANEISLAPTTGKNFNSIIGAGLSLTGTVDAIFSGATAGDTAAAGAYVISNPTGKKLFINTTDAYTYSLPDASGYFTQVNPATNTNWNGTAATDSLLPYAVSLAQSGATPELTTNATKIVVWVGVSSAGTEVLNPIAIDSTGTSDVDLTVQAIGDTNYVAGTSTAGTVSGFERSSAVQAVKLYAPNNVSATTAITTLAAASSATTTTAKIEVKTTYAGSINHTQVASLTTQNVFVGSVKKTLSSASSGFASTNLKRNLTVTAATADTSATSTYYNVTTGSAVATTDSTDLSTVPTALAVFALGSYSAQSLFNGVAIGAPSAVVTLSAGVNSTVAAVDVTTIDGANVDFTTAGAANSTQTVKVRPTTKAVTLTAQAQTSANANVEASNSEVKAVVTATKLDAASAASVTGGATALAVTGDSVTVYGRTDSTGKSDIVLNNTVGKAGDILTAVVSVKDTNGVWVDATTVTVTWETAALTALAVKPGLYVSGATVNVNFLAQDQFGEAISATADGALSVKGTAVLAGVESTTTYNTTVAVVAGKAAFSFANFATAGSSAVLRAKLYAGTTELSSYQKSVTIYNSLGTSKVAVADSFTTEVTYKDYVTGDSTDSAVAAKVAKTGIATTVNITGSVLNINNAGQPGAAVELSAPGVLFHAGTVWAQDKITAYADEYGNFTVGVAAHTVAKLGAVVTLTSDGKSATTKLKVFLPTGIAADNIKFAWALPSVVVKNTTYAVTATLADKWGNALPTTTNVTGQVSTYGVVFQGYGSLQVNSVDTAVSKNFDATGKAVVFVRSVKDIAGPGSVVATLGRADYSATSTPSVTQLGSLTAATTDSTATEWNEAAFKSELSSDVNVLDVAPAAVSTAVVAASGSTAKFYVSTSASAGKTVVVKVAGKFVKSFSGSADKKTVAIATSAGSKAVTVFVGGKLALTKTVTVK